MLMGDAVATTALLRRINSLARELSGFHVGRRNLGHIRNVIAEASICPQDRTRLQPSFKPTEFVKATGVSYFFAYFPKSSPSPVR